MSDKLAREGDHVFAVIVRNRSGQFAGEIDYRLSDLRDLPESEKQKVVDNIYALYEAACKATKLTATNVPKIVTHGVITGRFRSADLNKSNKPKTTE